MYRSAITPQFVPDNLFPAIPTVGNAVNNEMVTDLAIPHEGILHLTTSPILKQEPAIKPGVMQPPKCNASTELGVTVSSSPYSNRLAIQ